MSLVIPKTIHYCWFGGKPLPHLAKKCIASWKRYLPDYTIKEWNEDNFDVNIIPYTKEAYVAQKYAFVSDYARFKILYENGGLYFDTDVELIKPIDDIVSKGPFMGCECNEPPSVAPGLGLGAIPGMPIYKEMLDLYNSTHFIPQGGNMNLKTVVEYTSDILIKYGIKPSYQIQEVKGIWIYPTEYFCPKSIADGKIRLTINSRSIHHYDQSWQSPLRKYGRKIILFLGGERAKVYLKKFIRLK